MMDELCPYDRDGWAQVSGGKVWFGVCGDLCSTQPPVLVVHGGPGMSHDYLRPLGDLASERAVIFYDQLDAGRSDRPNNPTLWTIDRFLDEIESLKAALSLDRYVIFGNSWGGTLAAAHAGRQPDGLAGLILSSPLLHTDTWIADNAAYRAALPDDITSVMDHHEAQGTTHDPAYQAAVDVFYQRHLCRVQPWPAYVERTFEGLNGACYEAMWGPNEFTCTGVLSGYDGTDVLDQVRVSTLVTCGRFDEATPESCQRFAGQIDGATVQVFPNSSHMAFVEERAAYIDAVRMWLNAVS